MQQKLKIHSIFLQNSGVKGKCNEKSKIKGGLKILSISLLFVLYFLLIVLPFAEQYGFFNENISPQQKKVVIYYFLTIPIFIAYVWFVIVNFKNILFLKSLNYPAIVLNLFFGSFALLMAFGGTVLWLMIIGIPILFIGLLISFIIGVIKDINYFNINKYIK